MISLGISLTYVLKKNLSGVLLSALLFLANTIIAQSNQDSVIKKDSTPVKSEVVRADSSSIIKDSVEKLLERKKRAARIKKDSLHNLISHDSGSLKLLSAANDSVSTSPPFQDTGAGAGSDLTGHSEIGTFKKMLGDNPYFNFLGKSLVEAAPMHFTRSYDRLFYLLLGILFYFALIKVVFSKYLSNLLNLFFRVSMRQQQIREQVLQSPLPSLLLNILFVIVGGLYLSFIARYFNVAPRADLLVLLSNFSVVLAAIYLIKFLVLKSSGWIFNIQRATDTYIFIVFLTNKIMAILLLPFIVMLSFSATFVDQMAVTLSLILVLMLFVYRFVASYAPLRKEIKMNGFHFFLYLCAFEIAPLLLIYKVLLTYLEKAY